MIDKRDVVSIVVKCEHGQLQVLFFLVGGDNGVNVCDNLAMCSAPM